MAARLSEQEVKLCERLIVSVPTYLVAMVSLAAAYAIISFTHYDRLRAVSYLAGAETLLIAREIAARVDFGDDHLRKEDLPRFFPAAAQAARAPNAKGEVPQYVEDLQARGFTSEEISSAYVIGLESRLQQKRCRAAVVRLAPGKKIDFATFQIVGKTYVIDSQSASFAVFDNCLTTASGIDGIFVFRSGRDVVVGISEKIEKEFPPVAMPRPLRSFEYEPVDDLEQLLPEALRQYAGLPRPLILLHIDAIEHYLLAYASMRHGKYHAPAELSLAMENLYSEQEKSAALFGISAKLPLLIEGGPFVLFFLTFELWRRVRRIPVDFHSNSVFWFASDNRDFLGKLSAKSYSLLPVVCAGIVFISYALATSAFFPSLIEWHRMRLMLSSGVPLFDALKWVGISLPGTALLFVLPVQAALVILTSNRLLAMSTFERTNGPLQRKSSVWLRKRLKAARIRGQRRVDR